MLIPVAALALVLAATPRAQPSPRPAETHSANGGQIPTGPPVPAIAPAPPARAHRWVDLQSAAAETRYRYVGTSAGAVAANQMQHKESVRVGLKFDPGGRYSLQSFCGTGNSFTGSWDNLGPGTGARTWDFRVRQLYLQAAPAKGFEAQAGSFSIARGEQSEITSYDNDNYIIGYHGAVKRPKDIYFDELSVTVGYLGDVTTPNVFRRLDRLGDHNYSSVLLGKKIGVVSASADWASLAGISTFHQAVRVATAAWLPVDAVRFENYERVEGTRGYGFAAAAERAVTRRVTVIGGYADVDRNFGELNGDRYAHGHRIFTEGRITLLPELVVITFYTHAFKNDFVVPNHERFDLILSYNVLKALQRAGAW
jgi:hypothetical protein